MIDLHTHTLLSDGELLPSELVRRSVVKGYSAIALADHVDVSNLDFVVPRLVKAAQQLNSVWDIKVIPAAELTHIPLEYIDVLAKKARRLGAKLVLVHGETTAEPVLPGTNNAALQANIDILTHPGLISKDEVELAVKNNIYLELSMRAGHNQTNRHLIETVQGTRAKLILNTDAHGPEDLITRNDAEDFLFGLGLGETQKREILLNSRELISHLK